MAHDVRASGTNVEVNKVGAPCVLLAVAGTTSRDLYQTVACSR